MRILVATTHPSGRNVAYDRFLACLEQAPSPLWCTDPAQADAVMFFDNDYMTPQRYYARLRPHPLAQRFAGRCYLFSNTDWPAAYLPGVYPALTPATHSPGHTLASHYISSAISAVPARLIEDPRRDWLYSFVGRTVTAPVRARLLALDGGRGRCAEIRQAPSDSQLAAGYRDDYLAMLARSKFVLCPRGFGAGSIRLFEAMQCGRAPVIISDDWIAPEGPDWNSFSLRVRESEVAAIPLLLEQHEVSAQQMGMIAREQWLRWFSDAATPATIAGYVQQLAAQRGGRAADAAWTLRTLMAPRQIKTLVRGTLDALSPDRQNGAGD